MQERQNLQFTIFDFPLRELRNKEDKEGELRRENREFRIQGGNWLVYFKLLFE